MDRRAHPVDRRERAAHSRLLILACDGCGFLERWPWPVAIAYAEVRCTCPRCRRPMHERHRRSPGAPSASAAFEAGSSRDADL